MFIKPRYIEVSDIKLQRFLNEWGLNPVVINDIVYYRDNKEYQEAMIQYWIEIAYQQDIHRNYKGRF